VRPVVDAYSRSNVAAADGDVALAMRLCTPQARH
jgi:hypothetical protein